MAIFLTIINWKFSSNIQLRQQFARITALWHRFQNRIRALAEGILVMGNITVIQTVSNGYNQPVQFVNTETGSNNRTVQSGGTSSPGAWVPWCDSSEAFPMHHIQISAPKQVYYIYQSGSYIWGSPVGYGIDATQLGLQGENYELSISPNFGISLSISSTSEALSGGDSPLSSQ